jgi:type III secretion protein R
MEGSTPLIIGLVGGFFMLAVMTMTAFVKVSVVFMIVRNAIGLQQTPSNMIVMTLSLILAAFIAMPVLSQSFAAVAFASTTMELTSLQQVIDLGRLGIAPFQTFMARNTDPVQLEFFVGVTNEVWRGSGMIGTSDMFIVQVPAFMLSELTRAFELGFLLYLPFVAVDLAVTGILMALGMQQVQPSVLAVPFKLLLFVFLNGWLKLVEGLVTSYAA